MSIHRSITSSNNFVLSWSELVVLSDIVAVAESFLLDEIWADLLLSRLGVLLVSLHFFWRLLSACCWWALHVLNFLTALMEFIEGEPLVFSILIDDWETTHVVVLRDVHWDPAVLLLEVSNWTSRYALLLVCHRDYEAFFCLADFKQAWSWLFRFCLPFLGLLLFLLFCFSTPFLFLFCLLWWLWSLWSCQSQLHFLNTLRQVCLLGPSYWCVWR